MVSPEKSYLLWAKGELMGYNEAYSLEQAGHGRDLASGSGQMAVEATGTGTLDRCLRSAQQWIRGWAQGIRGQT